MFCRKLNVKDENNNAKNCNMFSNYIRKIPIEDDAITVSFDITSLYTNIPVIDMLNIRIMLIVMIKLLEKWLYLKKCFLI